MGVGHQQARRANTYCFIVAPVRVLYAREDARFGLYRCGTGLENGGGQGRMSTGSCGHCLSICLTERTTRSRIENYSEQRHADGERFGRVCRNATNKFPTKRLSVDHWSTQEFPRSKSHGPLDDEMIVQILQVYFTELEIQVKVIIQILSALELESKRQRGWVGDDPRRHRPQ